MRLEEGFTTFHGVVLDSGTARHFRYLERRLRAAIDRRHTRLASWELHRLKVFAGDVEDYRMIFEIIRREASDRWQRNFGVTWRQEVEA